MSPGYTTRDLFTYGGFIAGISIFMVSTMMWDVHYLVRLICGVIVGAGCSWIGEKIYNFMTAEKTNSREWPDDPNRDDER